MNTEKNFIIRKGFVYFGLRAAVLWEKLMHSRSSEVKKASIEMRGDAKL